MRGKNPASTAYNNILKELKTLIKAKKKQVKSEPHIWTFTAVQEAFKRRIELDRVSSNGFRPVLGKVVKHGLTLTSPTWQLILLRELFREHGYKLLATTSSKEKVDRDYVFLAPNLASQLTCPHVQLVQVVSAAEGEVGQRLARLELRRLFVLPGHERQRTEPRNSSGSDLKKRKRKRNKTR